MIICTRFKSLKKGCLLGFGSLYIEKWGIEIHNCSLNEKGANRWVSLPSQVYEKDGEKKYSPYITFQNKDHYKKFQELILEAFNKKLLEEETKQPLPEKMSISDSEDIPF